MIDAGFVLSCLVGGIGAAVYLGALAALVRGDHRNPVTRRFVDWAEHHGRPSG